MLPLQDALTSTVRTSLLILLGAVGFLLLVACANVMNLLLAQASARETELAIRSALGASRGRMVRQFMAETLLLSLAGGVIGVLAAYWGVHWLLKLAPPDTPGLAGVSVNLPVLFFASGLCLVVAIGLGTFTALRSDSNDIRTTLAEGGRQRRQFQRPINRPRHSCDAIGHHHDLVDRRGPARTKSGPSPFH
jgi:ABC-type antimicrobial peptide transport system permease subunit